MGWRHEDNLDVVELINAPAATTPTDAYTDGVGPSTRRPSNSLRLVAIVAALTLAAGLMGFLIGRAARPAPDARTTSLPIVGIAPDGVIGGTGRRCALRNGPEVQVGVEAENLGPDAVQLIRLDLVIPSGTRIVSTRVGTCGQLGDGQPVAGSIVETLGELWVSAVLTASGGCPRESSAEFRLTYMEGKHRQATELSAVADLGPVPYDSCEEGVSQRSSPGSGPASSLRAILTR